MSSSEENSESSGPSLWRHRDFMLLWSGQTVSEVGSAVTGIALPLLAVLTLKASIFEVSLLTTLGMLPFLLITLPAGAWVDRWIKRHVMLWSDAGRFVLIGSIPIAHFFGVLTLGQLYVVVFLSGVLTVFFDVAYQSYLPLLIESHQLIDGNGKIGASQSFGQFSGPSLGGLLVTLLGAAYAVAVDAVSFLVSTVATFFISHREPPQVKREDRRLRSEIAEGLGFVNGQPILRKIVACTATSNFGSGMEAAVIIYFVVHTLHLGAGFVGIFFTVGALGGFLGALLAGRIGRIVGFARIIWVSVLVGSPFAFMIALAQPGWMSIFVIVGFFAASATAVVYNVAQVSYRQRICPPELLGRMNASVRFVVWGATPLGALVGGAIGTATGARGVLYLAAFIASCSCLWVIFSPLFAMKDLPD